jgi:DHA1 family bicyclomycin/chloramphenicol resistance-like MFS transporter
MRALRSRLYVGNTLAYAFCFAVMMAYISASPFLYQVMIGMSPTQYGAAFGANALGLVVVSGVSAKLAATKSVRGLLVVGVGLISSATLSLLVLVLADAPVWLIPIPIFVAVASLGLVLGNSTALALGAVPEAAGSGSAILGALQFGLAAIVSPLVSMAGENSAQPLAMVMAASGFLGLVAVAVARPAKCSAL